RSREPDPPQQGDPGDPAIEGRDRGGATRVGSPRAAAGRLTFPDAVRPRFPLPAGGGSAARHPRAVPGPRAGRPLSDAAGRHRLGQDLHHGARARRLQPPDAGAVPQQDPRRPAVRGAQGFFPKNAVEFFISYYDYYQPEAYVPQTDTYIAKDSLINDATDRLRRRATSRLL